MRAFVIKRDDGKYFAGKCINKTYLYADNIIGAFLYSDLEIKHVKLDKNEKFVEIEIREVEENVD